MTWHSCIANSISNDVPHTTLVLECVSLVRPWVLGHGIAALQTALVMTPLTVGFES